MQIYQYKTRVAYDDINDRQQLTLRGAMGMMQEAAMLASARCGYGFTEVKQKGIAWLLSQWRIRMTGTAVWDTEILVDTWVKPMDKVKSIRNFEVKNEKGDVIAVGESIWTLVDVKTMRLMKLTDEVIHAYEPLDKDVFKSDKIPRMEKGEGTVTYEDTVTRRDLDTNHHMNNRIYVDWARNALPEEKQDTEFTELTVHYHLQLLPGAVVQCSYRRQGAAHVVDFYEKGDKRCCATVAFYETAQDN